MGAGGFYVSGDGMRYPKFWLLAGLIAGSSAVLATAAETAVLVFSKTAGFRHDSIPAGIEAIQGLADKEGWKVTATEDASVFTPSQLADFGVVVFLNTSGDILDDEQMAALRGYLGEGGGVVGVHAASDTEVDDPWYPRMIGASFKNHPKIQPAELTVNPAERSFPAVAHLPEIWARTDEWYDFRAAVPEAVRVLLTIGRTTYSDGKTGGEHPMAWYREFEGGRVFYTALGHTKESYEEAEFLTHLREGIRWAAQAK